MFETHAFTGKRQSGAVDASVSGEIINDSSRVSRPRVSLLPPELDSKVSAARKAIYNVLARHTFACDTVGSGSRGTRIVALRNAAQFVAEFFAATEVFNQVADEVAAAYDSIVAHNYDYWRPRFNSDGEYNDAIGNLIPGAAKIRAAFAVSYRMCDVDAHDDVTGVDSAVAEFFNEAIENAAAHNDRTVGLLATKPLADYCEALKALRTRLSTGKTITPDTMNGALAAGDLCVTMSDIVAPGPLAAIGTMREAINNAVADAEAFAAAGGSYTASFRLTAAQLITAIDQTVEACGGEAATTAQRQIAAAFAVSGRGILFEEDYGD